MQSNTTAPQALEPGLRSRLGRLTSRQLDTLGLIAQGYSNVAIAKHLVISEKSVENIINALFHELRTPLASPVHPRVMAALTYLRETRSQ